MYSPTSVDINQRNLDINPCPASSDQNKPPVDDSRTSSAVLPKINKLELEKIKINTYFTLCPLSLRIQRLKAPVVYAVF